jgi:subtilisin family serine protease
MDNLDAELRILLSEENQKTKERALSAASSADEAGRLVDVFLVYKNDLQPIRDIGYDLRSFTGNVTSGTIPIQKLALVAQHPNVVSIHIDGESYLELNDSISDIRANLARTRTGNTWNAPPNSFTGKGVIIGIIDSGIDFFHPTFRNTDAQKTTRILSIWDQTLLMSEEPATGGHLPTHIDGIEDAKLYGVEYDANKIKQALEAANSTAAKTFVRHEDTGGHGTHVAGIAAGNGSQDDGCHGAFYYAGVAPEADLIIVKYGNPTGNDLDTGNNSRVIDAIRYIITRSKAAGKRAVFNMSFGDGTGSRDGKTIYEHTIDMLLAEADSNQIIGVKSAGNRGDSKGHAKGVLPASGNLELEFNQIANGGAEKIEIWYDSTNSVSCTIKQPNDKLLGPVTEGGGTTTFPAAGSDDTINRGGSVTVSHGVNFDSSAKKILIKL